MAMNKAEQAQLEALQVRLALRWTEPPVPIDTAVALAASNGEPVVAWCANGYSLSASQGWFTSVVHKSEGPPRKSGDYRSSATQGCGGPWFASRADALRWARHEAEKRFAADLRRIDVWIAKDADQ